MRKLAHIRLVGYGLRTWDSPRYVIPLPSPSYSEYDAPQAVGPTHASQWNPNLSGQDTAHGGGVLGPGGVFPPAQRARPARIGAQFGSALGAARWQSLFLAGPNSWEHLMPSRPMISQGRTLTQNFNPNQPGSKEQQKATVYNPWPSFGAISPKAV